MSTAWDARALLASQGLALLLALFGCELDEAPLARRGGGGGSPVRAAAARCEDGAVRECSVTLGEHNGVLSCITGERRCAAGEWLPCEGTVSRRSRAELARRGAEHSASGLGTLALSEPGECENNPCDPRCRVYDEVPTEPLSPPGAPVGVDWQAGDLADLREALPPGFVAKGQAEPCEDGADCQFDHHCQSPVTGSSCEHSKCSTGAALDAGCNPCVASICAEGTHPECCSSVPAGSCAHSPCEAGGMLVEGCSSCATSVCAAHPECCVDPDLPHDVCTTGSALSATASTCTAEVCAEDPSCCGQTGKGSCAHTPCSTGSRLHPACNPLLATTCSERPGCCAAAGCPHDPCETGARLSPSCNADYGPSIEAVCRANPGCCQQSECEHDACSTGASLAADCHPLVAAACERNPSCCQEWHAGTAGCSHGPCSTGPALETGCDAEGPATVDDVCAERPECCTSSCRVHPCSTSSSQHNGNCEASDPHVEAVCDIRPQCCGRGSGQRRWSAICRDLYLELRGITDGEGCDGAAAWDAACRERYTALALGAGISCQDDWGDTCVEAVEEAMSEDAGAPRSCPTSWSSTCVDLYQDLNGASACSGWTSSCVESFKEHTGASCATSWTQACVDRVASACGIDCQDRDWDADCVAAVADSCGQACGGWDATCVEAVTTVCGAFCATDGSCDHSKCLAGARLDAGCDACVTSICELDPYCCEDEWDDFCVVKVGSVCSIQCSGEEGQCVPWNTLETDATCERFDLTIGVPCGSSVPICNRGAEPSPAHLKFYVFSGNSPHMGDSCSPTIGQNDGECDIPVSVPPGECVNVACDELPNLGELMVNPLSSPAHDARECSCLNNWSAFWKNGNDRIGCEPPLCASAQAEATLAQSNLFFIYDRSGSMCEPGSFGWSISCPNPRADSRWSLTRNALRSFLESPSSAGMGVALRFFPGTVSGHDCSGALCGTFEHCAVPLVPLAELTEGTDATLPSHCASAADPQECLLVKALNATYPAGYTPTYIALGGAIDYMKGLAQERPYERWHVVLVTDGEPNDCSEDHQVTLPALSAEAYRRYGIVTHTIGIDHQGGTEELADIARAGHGLNFMVSATESGTGEDFAEALDEIRRSAASCEIVIDRSTLLDPDEVEVTYSGVAGSEVLAPLADDADCGEGWTFDDPAVPTRVILCPDTCARVREDTSAKLSVMMGCPMRYEPMEYSQVYTATCPEGQTHDWGYLSYTTVTPGSSRIVFSAAVAPDEAALASADASEVAVAHGPVSPYTTDTQFCPLGSECMVTLYDELPPGAGTYLEIRFSVLPGGLGEDPPELIDWQVTHSCVESE